MMSKQLLNFKKLSEREKLTVSNSRMLSDDNLFVLLGKERLVNILFLADTISFSPR